MTATAPAPTEAQKKENHSILYWAIGIVLLGLSADGSVAVDYRR